MRVSSPAPSRSQSWLSTAHLTVPQLWQTYRKSLTTWWHSSEEEEEEAAPAQPEDGAGAVTPAAEEVHHLQPQSAQVAGSPMSNAGTVESTGTPSLGVRPRTILRSKPSSRRPLSPPRPENRLRGRGARMQQLRLRLSHTKTPTPPGVSPPQETRREGLRLSLIHI